ncbi:MAG: hypothetical protein WDZ35_12090 [Crocinitomicaceae bacterium]
MSTFKSFAADFYVGREIPVFTAKEQQALDEFGIRFIRLERISQVKKHNEEVSKLIEDYGDRWKDSLISSVAFFGESNKEYIKYICTIQSLNKLRRARFSRRKSYAMSYHSNGMIAEIKIKIPLRKNGGGMFHFRIKTKNWNKKGQRIKGSNKVLYGSAC